MAAVKGWRAIVSDAGNPPPGSQVNREVTQRQHDEQRRVEQHHHWCGGGNSAMPTPSRSLSRDADGHQCWDGAKPEAQHAYGAVRRVAARRTGGQRRVEKTAGQEAENDAERVATPWAPAQPGN